MALNYSPEASKGIYGAMKGALNMFSPLNKADGVNENSNVIPVDEYESNLDEVEILDLIGQWRKAYSVYYTPIQKSQELAFDYWIGKHRTDDKNITVTGSLETVDNLIFEALETFLPIATRANPDPLVTADPSELGQQVAHDIKAALVDLADTLKLRRKLARMARHWAIYRLGVTKTTWNPITKSINQENVNPKRMIFDKDGYIDEGGLFVGEYEGEKKKATADLLTQMFPKKKDKIIAKARGKMGTKLDYYEWWYRGKDLFFTIDEDTVLGKFKNPNWNYDGTTKETDETGEEVESDVQGTNHLKEPTSPYRYMAIFNTGLQPHDETSLILQTIPAQDTVNKTNRQIDRNVDSMNNGGIVSGKSFTEDQASQAAAALRRGVFIRVPNGDVREAFMRTPAPPLPADVFNNLNDKRNEIKNMFGTSGSTPQGLKSTESARGKILVNQMDSSRIGGGITEQIEQVADSVYNLWVQFMFVYYDEEHFITTAGSVAGLELITLKNSNFPLLKTLSITVKEGSLVPKDPLTQRNEAVDLWSANAIDPLSLYKKLDFPDPVQATNQLILWQMLQKGQVTPQMYLPTFKVEGQAAGGLPTEQPATGGPPVNAPTGVDTGATPPPPGSAGAEEVESKALLGSVKI